MSSIVDYLLSPGAYGDSEKKTYYRMMKSIDASYHGQIVRVLSMFGDAVLRGLAVKVVLDPQPATDTNNTTQTLKPSGKTKEN